MVQKVNGRVAAGEFLTGNLDFYTVTTSINILPEGATGAEAPTDPAPPAFPAVRTLANSSQARLNKLVEVISLRGQPIIIGGVVRSGSAGSYSYKMTFAIEHENGWEAVSTTALRDAVALHGVDGGFTTSNTSAVFAASL